MEKISIVVPCYNEEETIFLFYKEIISLKEFFDQNNLIVEICFVDDGSIDDTLKEIKKIREYDIGVHYITFSRNFGKEAALYAGLNMSTGDYIIVMDADLQDPPEIIPQMYHLMKQENCDCVATRRTDRQGEPPIRSFFAKLFYRIINKISDTKIVDGARDFRIMTRIMVNAILEDKEYNRFSKGIFSWIGFKTAWLEFNNRERIAGETKWSFRKLFLYSIEGLLAFSTVPLSVSSMGGLLFCSLSIFLLIFVIVRALLFGDTVAGWPSLVSIILFLSGIQLFSIGVIGLYLSKIYLETKRRPLYIIKEQQ